jgi:hypothetical protein
VYKWKEVDKETYDKLSESPHSVLKEEDGKYYHAKTKCKGRFEFEGLALHKNKSNLIVRKALFHYFVHGTDPEEYLKSNRNIFDYCSGVKIRGNWKFHSIGVDNSVVVSTPLQKTLRYYISNKGCKIIKVNQGDGREIQTESGKWLQTVFNVYEIKQWEDYDINEQYYLNAINKEIKNITPYVFDNQLTLNF